MIRFPNPRFVRGGGSRPQQPRHSGWDSFAQNIPVGGPSVNRHPPARHPVMTVRHREHHPYEPTQNDLDGEPSENRHPLARHPVTTVRRREHHPYEPTQNDPEEEPSENRDSPFRPPITTVRRIEHTPHVPAQNHPTPVESTPYNCSEYLEALKSIQQAVQCCSCHKPLQSARNCAQGHGICSPCKNRHDSICPLCDSFISACKPILLNNIIKLLPRKCNYLENGCESLVLASDTDHESFCRFRNVSCRFPSCEVRCLAKELLRHLEYCHGKDMIRTARNNSIIMGFDAKIAKKGLAVIVAYNNIIWQHTKCGNNSLVQFYQYVPMEKPKVKLSVVVNLHTPQKSFSGITPVHTDKYNPEQLFKDKQSFCLPKKIAASFKQFYGGVNYNFNIIKKDL